jgi:hypothetical protein
LVFAHDAAHVQGPLHQPLLASGQDVEDLAQLHERRFASQFVNDISLCLGDHQRPTNRAAALRDDGPQADRTGNERGDGSFNDRLLAIDQSAAARLVRSAGHPADHSHAGPVFVHPLQKIGGERERIAQEHQEGALRPLAGKLVRPTVEGAAFRRPLELQVHRHDARARPTSQPQRERWPFLHLARRADDRLAACPQHVVGPQQLADLLASPPHAGVMRGEEHRARSGGPPSDSRACSQTSRKASDELALVESAAAQRATAEVVEDMAIGPANPQGKAMGVS